MEAALAIRVPLATAPVPTSATEPCAVCPRIASEFEGWRLAAYWRAQHERAIDREGRLKEKYEHLEVQNRLLKQKIFGKSSESSTGAETATKRRGANGFWHFWRAGRRQPPDYPRIRCANAESRG